MWSTGRKGHEDCRNAKAILFGSIIRYCQGVVAPQARANFGDAGPGFSFHHLSAGAWHGRARPNIVRSVMRISARNQIKGTVLEVKKGATTSHIRVDIGNGQIVTSSITNEAVDELGIKAKDKVIAVVKASDVMIAVD
jgi:molybdopterin-binding protein